jgi:hypothetical protein
MPHTPEAIARSFGRKAMTHLKFLAAPSSRQMDLLFDNRRLEGLDPHDRDKVISALAQILMQAAGLDVEELDDDKR